MTLHYYIVYRDIKLFYYVLLNIKLGSHERCTLQRVAESFKMYERHSDPTPI